MRFATSPASGSLSTSRRPRALAWPAAAVLSLACAMPAAADFRLCNNTASRIGVAIGYRDAGGWITEGWWNLPPRSCETVLRGALSARYYYVYAIDYDRGGEWAGQAYMCTRPKEFTIQGVENCLARGFDRTGFLEIDAGQQRAWTVQLTDSAELAGRPQAPALMPMLTVRPPQTRGVPADTTGPANP